MTQNKKVPVANWKQLLLPPRGHLLNQTSSLPHLGLRVEAALITDRGLNVNISFHTMKSNPALGAPFIANPQLPDYGSRRYMTQTHKAANGETFSGCRG